MSLSHIGATSRYTRSIDMKNICDDCDWVISEYHYTYDDRGFIVGEDVTESLYAYAWDDKHDGKHENWHDDKYPHGDKHINKHAKDGIYNFQIIGTKRTFEYDDDGKLTKATETEDRQGTYVYEYGYDDMGNRTSYSKSRNGKVQEGAEYTYNLSNQMVAARLYDGKHYKNVEYTYDADGNRILQEEVKPDGERKVELTYDYSVENRLKAVHDKNDLLVAMAYDGDGSKGLAGSFLGLFTGDSEEAGDSADTSTTSNASPESKGNKGNKDKDKGNDGNDKNNGKGNGNGNSGNNGNGNSGNNGNGNSGNNGNTSTDGSNDNNGNANGNTNNTGGSQNQSGILFPIDGEVSELESELIGMIKTTGKEKNYELVEYVNDVNREHTEVLMELNINGIMDTAYSYGNERLTNERFTGWTGYYTYDPRGSVTGVTDNTGMIWQSYRYNVNGDMTFGKPQYNNVYSYNAESYNPNMESQYLRARYYNVPNGNFLTEDSYLGNITDPLTLNRYNYVKSSPLNYIDPSGHYNENLRNVRSINISDFVNNSGDIIKSDMVIKLRPWSDLTREEQIQILRDNGSSLMYFADNFIEDGAEKEEYIDALLALENKVLEAHILSNISECDKFSVAEFFKLRGAIYYGFTVSGGSGSFQMNISAVIAIDPKGNIVMQIASGPEGTTTPAPPNLTISFVGGDTNAEHVSNLEGPGSSLGMGGPLPPIYGVPFGFATDEIYGLDEDGNVLWKGTSLVTSVGTPKLEAHGSYTRTKTVLYLHREKS